MFLAYLKFPEWIKPELIPGVPLGSWYGMMYLFAFTTAWFLFMHQIKKRREILGIKVETKKKRFRIPAGITRVFSFLRFPKQNEKISSRKINLSEDAVGSFFIWSIVGLMLGARIFSVLVYADDRIEYWTKPWLIFWPFDENWKFIGLRCMSYHGGVIGTIVATVTWCRVKGQNFWDWADMLSAGIPLGYTFGRLGNFINQELYGRVTTSPIGMLFDPPGMERFSSSRHPWATEIAQELDLPSLGMINLPRHPSQLYEAFFEGIVLWAILWFVVSRLKRHNGQMLGGYLLGYGFFRFIIEYYRQPDSNLNYLINFTGKKLNPALEHPLGAISMGQILCFLMIVGGLGLILLAPVLDRSAQKRCEIWAVKHPEAFSKKEDNEQKGDKKSRKKKK